MLATKVKKSATWIVIISLFAIKLLLVVLKSPPIEVVEAKATLSLPFLTPLNLRILGLLILFASSVLFGLLAKRWIKLKKNSNLVFFTSFTVFFLSPWENAISTFYIIPNIITLIFIASLYFLPKKIFPILITLVILSIVHLKGPYAKYFYISAFTPRNLGTEINREQNLIYLSVNKKFILPALVRKAVYNKPLFAINKLVNHAVSFFDFEQLAAPFDSYAITRLSGLSPKGNLPAFFFWEIPLIIFGIYQFLKDKPYFDKKKLFLLFVLACIPYLFFEKKILIQTGFLTAPLFILAEVYALNCLLLKTCLSINCKIITVTAFLIFIYFSTNYYYLFHFNYFLYQTSHPHVFREISSFLSAHGHEGKKFVVTTRFGPTDMIVLYYLRKNLPPNTSFRSIELANESLQPNTYYIGLPGEYVGSGKELTKRPLPKPLRLIDTIKADEEMVSDYGDAIWITYSEK